MRTKEQLRIYKKKLHARGKQRVKEAITCLKLSGHDPTSGLMLDLGCGLGHPHECFLKNGIEAVGVELSKKN
jgi:SAM-dependent methyltransferase